MTDIVLNDGTSDHTYKNRNLNDPEASTYRTVGEGTIFATNAYLNFSVKENTSSSVRKFVSTISVPKEQTVDGVTTILHTVRAKLELFVPLTAESSEISAIIAQLVDLTSDSAYTNGTNGIVP